MQLVYSDVSFKDMSDIDVGISHDYYVSPSECINLLAEPNLHCSQGRNVY